MTMNPIYLYRKQLTYNVVNERGDIHLKTDQFALFDNR